MSLLTLPAELLCLVFSFLETPDLSRVSLVSIQYNILAEPFLWNTYRCMDGVVARGFHTSALFLRSIVERPELAQHVKELYRSSISDDQSALFPIFDSDDEYVIPAESDMRLFERAITNIKVPERLKKRLRTKISRGSYDAEVALLLCLLPNLELLFVKIEGAMELVLEIFGLIESKSFDGLKNLRTIWIESAGEYWGGSLTPEYRNIFKMPSVKKFKSALMYCKGALEMEPETSAVEHIVLRETYIVKEAVQPLIRSCKALKTFHVTSDYNHHGRLFTPYDAVEALHQHLSTLEELTILKYSEIDCRAPGLLPHEVYIGTALRGFENLKTLNCEMENLLGIIPGLPHLKSQHSDLVDSLPMSIENLTILKVDEQIIPHLQKLEDVTAQQFPKLRQVRISLLENSVDKILRLQIEMLEVILLDDPRSIDAVYDI